MFGPKSTFAFLLISSPLFAADWYSLCISPQYSIFVSRCEPMSAEKLLEESRIVLQRHGDWSEKRAGWIVGKVTYIKSKTSDTACEYFRSEPDCKKRLKDVTLDPSDYK